MRGKYYPDRSLITGEREPPLSLEVAANDGPALAAALTKIKEVMQAGPSIGPGGSRDRGETSSAVTNVSRVFAPFEMPLHGSVRQKILGPQVRGPLVGSPRSFLLSSWHVGIIFEAYSEHDEDEGFPPWSRLRTCRVGTARGAIGAPPPAHHP